METGHLVVLGFYPGEYTLLRQLILAESGEGACIVVAEDMDRDKISRFNLPLDEVLDLGEEDYLIVLGEE